jgi:GTPase SAR1 family protein
MGSSISKEDHEAKIKEKDASREREQKAKEQAELKFIEQQELATALKLSKDEAELEKKKLEKDEKELREQMKREKQRQEELEKQLLADRETAKQELAKALEDGKKRDNEQTAILVKLQEELAEGNKKWTAEEQKKKEAEANRLKKIQSIKEKAKARGIDTINNYNIGIIGQAGTGKSALLNAIVKGKTQEQVQTKSEVKCINTEAKSGITETTLVPQAYDYPDMPIVKVWDIPGAGTRLIPMEQYFEEMSLFCFDYLIVVVGPRIMQWDSDFVKKALRYNVSAVFVRSKSDQELASTSESLFEDQYMQLDEDKQKTVRETVKNNIKKYFQEELDKCGCGSVGHYFLGSFAIMRNKKAYPKFDEERFFSDVISTCSTRKHKRIDIDSVEILI